MVLSATSALDGARNPFEHVIKQGVFAVLGIPLMFIASRLPVAFWRRMAWPVLIGATAFQLLVFVPGLGIESYGNRNWVRSEEHTSELQSLMRISYAVFCLKKQKCNKYHCAHDNHL